MNISSKITTDRVGDKVIGSWRLKSWVYRDTEGQERNYFSDKPDGILSYHENGYMNAQLMHKERSLFASSYLGEWTCDEARYGLDTYLAYWGPYYEREPGVIVHKVEGSLFPNWVGLEQVRYVRVLGDKMMISTPPILTENGVGLEFLLEWIRM